MNKLTFIATAHNETWFNRSFINSIVAQTNCDFEAVIYHNGHNKELREYIENEVHLPQLRYRESETDTGSWGTRNRQVAINECKTEYIIQTSIQDYWLPQAVDYILKGLEQSPDILLWDSINHLVGPCQVLNAKMTWSKIDWGNFAIKTSIAKQMKIKHGEYCSDWLFIKECIDRKLINPIKILKLNAILTIHN